VAQAVFESTIPIISAVGHETDTTIVDFVADLRAPTPSAAAELAVDDIGRLEERLTGYASVLQRLLSNRLEVTRYRLLSYQNRLRGLSPVGRMREKRTYALALEERLTSLMADHIRNDRFRMELLITRLQGLSPLTKLNQGFSYVADADGRAVTDVERVSVGEPLTIHVKNGVITASVTHKRPEERMVRSDESGRAIC
jgi:exodeoxyribonuclease VII large subunit